MIRQAHDSGGYVLLPVAVAVALIGIIAYFIASQSAQNVNVAAGELEAARANYVAQAGMQHALRQLDQQGCGPYTDIGEQPFGADKYSAILTTGLGATTSYTLGVDQDGWIRDDNPDKSHPTDSKLHLQRDSKIERPVYRYDLSSIPPQSPVLSARAWFYVTGEHPAGPVEILALNRDWTETDASWDRLGKAMGLEVLATIPAQVGKDVWVAVNLTTQVQAWVNGQSNYGLALNPLGEGDHGDYASRESANPPYLEVIVGSATGSPAKLESVATLATGIERRIVRNDVKLYQQPPMLRRLQPAAADAADAYIWAANKDSNYGSDDETWVATGNNNTALALFKFDLTALPPGVKVLAASLSVYHRDGNDNDVPVTAHRITNAWLENEVTWNHRDNANGWDNPGGDYDPNAVASTLVDKDQKRFYEWDITRLVKGWVNGEFANHGVLLRTAETAIFGERFNTSDHADASQHPQLLVTYSCICGQACLIPQGVGRIVMIGNYTGSTADPADLEKAAMLESWGYQVDILDDDLIPLLLLLNLAGYDLVYISSTANSSTVGSQLKDVALGVVNELGSLNDDFELAEGNATRVGDSVDIVDASHYISAPFAPGALPVYAAHMEFQVLSGDKAAGLQNLADVDSRDSLALLDEGAETEDGNPAAGRRVNLPLGRSSASNFNWKYLNNNGRLLVQRTIQWGTGYDGTCVPGNFRDEFENDSFSNSDGSLNWAGAWIELDAAGSGVSNGKARITSNELRLSGPPSGDDPNLVRELDLSNHLSATLSFDFSTDSDVDAGADGVVLEISADGGGNWTLLEDFINVGPDVSSSRSYHISNYLSANTRIRFRVSAGYSGGSEFFYVDNFDIDAGCDPPPAMGPLAHWSFDETSGTIATDLAGGHHGSLVNTPVWGEGRLGGGLVYDGINDEVLVAHDDTLSLSEALTFTAWINSNSYSGYKAILTKGVYGTQNFRFGTLNNELWLDFNIGGAWPAFVSSGVSLMEGTWYHVAATFDNASDSVRLYIDGSEVFNGVLALTPETNTGDLRVGNGTFPGGDWNGTLDDVRIYDRALSASEIADLATVPQHVLLVTAQPDTLSSEDSARLAMFESWGFAVNLIDDNASQSTFDSAIGENDVVFVSVDAEAGTVGSKLVDAGIGVVIEERNLADEFNLADNVGQFDFTDFTVIDNNHYVTESLTPGDITLFTSAQQAAYIAGGQTAPGMSLLGSWGSNQALGVIESGGELLGGGTAAGRRVYLPWGGSNGFDPDLLSNAGKIILKRAIEWGAGAGSSCSADFTPTVKVDEFGTSGYGSNDIKGLTYYPEGKIFKGVAAPAGGAWISVDDGATTVLMTDSSGALLTSATLASADPTGIAYVSSGMRAGYFAITDYYASGVSWMDPGGAVVASFADPGFANPVGVAYIDQTASGSYEESLVLISYASGSWLVHITDQNGTVLKQLDVSAITSNPEDIAHIPRTDKLLIVDRGSREVIAVDFNGAELSRYSLTGYGSVTPNGIIVNPLTCDHVIADLGNDLVVSLNANDVADATPGYHEIYAPWSAGSADTWEVVDLAPFGVAPDAVVEVAVLNNSGSAQRWGGVRAVGSSLERRFMLHEAESGGVDSITLHVQADANGRIEHYSDRTSDVSFVALGYWVGPTYVELLNPFTANTSNAWSTENLAAAGLGPDQVAEVAIVNTRSWVERLAGIRAVGSSLQRRLNIHEAESGGIDAVTLMVETNASSSIEVYAENNADIGFYLLGYWQIPPGSFTELGGAEGQATDSSSWQAADLSGFGIPADAVAQFVIDNNGATRENFLGLRATGSALNRMLELQEAEAGGSDLATMHVPVDAGAGVEWYAESFPESKFHPLGWWDISL